MTSCVLSKIDVIVCLGGDGTLLYASSLFTESVPPIMAFNLGKFLSFIKNLIFVSGINKILN